MDDRRFDLLTRDLAAATSRRQVLRAVAMALAGGVLARPRGAARARQDDRAAAAAEAAREISRLEAASAFDALYDLLHPDGQAIVPRAVVVGWYGEFMAGKETAELTVTAVRFVSWTWAVTGVTYPETAEVGYVQPFWAGGVRTDVADTVRLVEAEGAWRWFFGRSREFIEEQIARFGGESPGIAPAATSEQPPSAPRTVAYTVTDLGTLDGFDSSGASAINNAGEVVGTTSGAGGWALCSFLWRDGRLTQLGTVPVTGSCLSGAAAINDAGQVAGGSALPERPAIAYLWEDGETVDLGKLPGDVTAFAYGLNAFGQVVGESSAPTYFTQTTDDPPRAFQADGTWLQELAPLPGGGSSGARAINDAGLVAGWSAVADGSEHAVVWLGGQASDLGTLPGQNRSRAFAVNGSGQVVGISGDNLIEGSGTRAFLYSDERMTDLGVLPEGTQTYADDINEAGLVVGASGMTAAEAGWVGHAALYADGRLVDLNHLIPADSGWVLSWAHGINDAGQIVGTGTIDGQTRAFLLTPVGAELALLQDARVTADLARDRIENVREAAHEGWQKGEYFARAYPRDQAEAVVESIVGLLDLFNVASASKALKLVRPGLFPAAHESLLGVARDGGHHLTAFLLGGATPLTGAAGAEVNARLLLTPAIWLAKHLGEAFVDELAEEGLVRGSGKLAEWFAGVLARGDAHQRLYELAAAAAEEHRALIDQVEARVRRELAGEVPAEPFREHLTQIRLANELIQARLWYLTQPLVGAFNERLLEEQDAVRDFAARVLTVAAAGLIGGPIGASLARGQWYVIDYIKNKRKLAQDVQMAQAGIDCIWGSIQAMVEIFLNTYNGLGQLVDRATYPPEPQIARGRLAVADHLWQGGASYSEVEIANRGTAPVLYQISARYDRTDEVPWLWKSFGSHLVHAEHVVELDPGASAVVPVYYARDGVGTEPNRGGTISFEVLGTTETGTYFVTRLHTEWEP